NGVINRAHGRGLGLLAQLGSGTVLTLGQSINAIVEEDVIDVEVAPDGMNKMIAANRQGIPVARDHPNTQVRICTLDAGSNGGSTAVDTVEAVSIHVVRKAR